jgi:hypothetical protein
MQRRRSFSRKAVAATVGTDPVVPDDFPLRRQVGEANEPRGPGCLPKDRAVLAARECEGGLFKRTCYIHAHARESARQIANMFIPGQSPVRPGGRMTVALLHVLIRTGERDGIRQTIGARGRDGGARCHRRVMNAGDTRSLARSARASDIGQV